MDRWDHQVLRSFTEPLKIRGQFPHFEKFPDRDQWELNVRSVFKDRGETKQLLDWIYPYIDELWLGFLGYIIRDGDEHPYLIYYRDDGIRFMKVGCDEEEDFPGKQVVFNWRMVDVTGD